MEKYIPELTEIVKKITNVQSIAPTEDLKKVGIDSLNMLTVLVNIECDIGIEIPDEELNLSNFETIRTIAKLLSRLEDSSAMNPS